MTPTEDDLRSSLRLLKQRAPADAPDVPRGEVPLRRRWGSIAQIVSVAALVIVVAGGAAVLGLHHDRATPTQRSGATSAGPRKPPRSQAAGLATLHVRVALFGGQVRPNGKKRYADNRPQQGATVVVTSVANGGGAYQSQLRITATTNRDGVAAFGLPAGRYRYHWGVFRSAGPVRLTPGQHADVQLDCAVP